MRGCMEHLTLANIAKVCGGTLYQAAGAEETVITCGVIDSRKLEQGGLFFAAGGERVDGHKFIGQVFEKGAACVVTEKTPAQVEAEHGVEIQAWGPYILVENTFEALKKIAAYHRENFTIPVVGITGSVGKTSTKEFIAGVLSEKFNVLKTEGNFNNEIGLPLTLLRIKKEHEVAVVEMGISDFGEMSRLGKMARPDICVITNIGQCHLENLHDRNGVFRAKTEIFDYMQPDGEVCLNAEDDILSKVGSVNGKSVHYFGLSDSAHAKVYATDIENRGLLGSRAQMNMDKNVYPVEVPLPGQHMVLNAMAAATVGKLLGLSAEEIQEGIKNVKPVDGRSHIMQIGDKTVIDDCYNANPVSMKAAIDLLNMGLGRKVAILGDMFELGANSDAMHGEVGAYAVQNGVDALYFVGENSRFMYEAALKQKVDSQDVRHFATKEELIDAFSELLEDGDTILIKASHGMQFARLVDAIQDFS